MAQMILVHISFFENTVRSKLVNFHCHISKTLQNLQQINKCGYYSREGTISSRHPKGVGTIQERVLIMRMR